MRFGKTLIIQPSPGIGDMIWHIPYLRAIARCASNGKISLLTKSRNLTKNWLHHDPLIEDIFYIERKGLTQSIDIIKKGNFDTVWTLHRSFSYAFMAWLAGVKKRYGFGYGLQKYILTQKDILEEPMRHWHTIDQVKKLLEISHIDHNPSDQTIILPSQLIDRVRKDLGSLKGAIALGIGGSMEEKRWKSTNFISLTLALNSLGYKKVFICGGPSEEKEADFIISQVKAHQGKAIKATSYPIDYSMALVGECDFYLGNDSALLNAAVCRGTPALGFFGKTPPLTYSPLIHPITGDTMEAITVENVIKTFKVRTLKIKEYDNAF